MHIVRTLLTVLTTLFLGLTLALVSPATPAAAHEEREATFPDGSGKVPRFLGLDNPRKRVVCTADSRRRINRMPAGALKRRNQALLRSCRFGSIQDAINSIKKPNTSVYVLPGVYREAKWAEKKRSDYCSNLETDSDDPLDAASYIGSITDPLTGQANAESDPIALSYGDQRRCKHNLNLIAVFGDSTPGNDSMKCDSRFCGLQLVGTGRRMLDVVIDNRFSKLNALRADRMSGFYLRNMTVQQAEFNSIYVLETDGFVIDRVTARANDEYGILAFASDHGVIKRSNTYFNGDSGIYPGSASDVNGDNTNFEPTRYSIVIKHNKSHHNALGYSGTAGNSVYAHDNEFAHNATGIATDSLFPGHPGLPQDHARWSRNKIHSNNINYFEKYVHTGVCAEPMEERGYMEGVVCPVIPTPVGTGVLIAGGNYNSTDNNWIYNNWRYGTMQFMVPAALRDEYDPTKQTDTSHHNRTVGNKMGFRPDGAVRHNGQDHWWDDQGMGNCWEGNTYSRGERTDNFTIDPRSCDAGGSFNPIGMPVKDADFLSCSQYDRNDEFLRNPPMCSWFQTPAKPTAGGDGSLLTLGERQVAQLTSARESGSPEDGVIVSTMGVGGLAVLLLGARARRRRAS